MKCFVARTIRPLCAWMILCFLAAIIGIVLCFTNSTSPIAIPLILFGLLLGTVFLLSLIHDLREKLILDTDGLTLPNGRTLLYRDIRSVTVIREEAKRPHLLGLVFFGLLSILFMEDCGIGAAVGRHASYECTLHITDNSDISFSLYKYGQTQAEEYIAALSEALEERQP